MSRRDPDLLLEDILECSNNILGYTADISYDAFLANRMLVDAVVRNIEIIGEAAGRLPQEYKDKSTSVDWHKIRGLRNRIIHDYFEINYDIIWTVIQSYIPELASEINILLKNL